MSLDLGICLFEVIREPVGALCMRQTSLELGLLFASLTQLLSYI